MHTWPTSDHSAASLYAYISNRNISIRQQTIYSFINAHINKTRRVQLSHGFTFAKVNQLVILESLYVDHFGVEYDVLCHFQQYLRYIVAVSVTLLFKKKTTSRDAVVLRLTLALSAKHHSSSQCTIQSRKIIMSVF